MKFKKYLKESKEQLNEVLVTFGKKAYPKFGNIVILAGGAGSGKGFVIKNLLGIEGKTLDVDALKILASGSELAAKKYPDLKDIRNKIKNKEKITPEMASRLHVIVKELGYESSLLKSLGKSIISNDPDRKPNLIFDVTLKNEKKLKQITAIAEKLKYKKENIHIVWVLQNTSIAMELNMKRTRNVADEILLNTHQGALNTMTNILKSGVTSNINGDVYIALNRPKLDAKIIAQIDRTGKVLKSKYSKNKIVVIDKAVILHIKEKNKPFKSYKEIFKFFLNKVKDIYSKEELKNTIKWFNGLKKGKITENYIDYLSSL